MATCDRCQAETLATVVSYFNLDVICMECKAKERAHPDFQRAQDAEIEACRRGDYNFPGIGKPSDL